MRYLLYQNDSDGDSDGGTIPARGASTDSLGPAPTRPPALSAPALRLETVGPPRSGVLGGPRMAFCVT